MDWRGYIAIDPEILAGKPTLKGTRLAVEHILDLLAAGWTHDQLLEAYPTLTEGGIRAALAFAAQTIREERVFPNPRHAA